MASGSRNWHRHLCYIKKDRISNEKCVRGRIWTGFSQEDCCVVVLRRNWPQAQKSAGGKSDVDVNRCQAKHVILKIQAHDPINTGFYYSRLNSCAGLLFTELLKLGCEQYCVLVVGNMSAHSDYPPVWQDHHYRNGNNRAARYPI